MQYPERQLLGQYQCVPVKLHQQCLGANGGRNLVHIFSPLDSSGSAKGVFYCVHHCTPNTGSTPGIRDFGPSGGRGRNRTPPIEEGGRCEVTTS